VALLEKRGFLYNHSGDFPQVILIVPSHVPNTGFMVKPWLEKAIANSKNHHLYRIIIATLKSI
jgi:hypothetical protein